MSVKDEIERLYPDCWTYPKESIDALLSYLEKDITATLMAAFLSGFDSGTGDAGSYLKLPDGTMVQWGTVQEISFSSATIVEGTVNLDEDFADNKFTVVASGNSSSNNAYVFRVGVNPATKSSFTWTLASGSGTAITTTNRGFSWLAIGKWK